MYIIVVLMKWITMDVDLKRVTNVRVAEVGSDHVRLVWQSPDGDLLLYEVSYGTDNFYRNITLAYSIQSNITLRQLRQHTVYMFRVRQKHPAILAFLSLIANR